MKKQELYQFLRSKDIVFEITEHKAVYNMAEVAEIGTPHPEKKKKNIFIRDDKKHNYYLITVKGDKRVDLKSFREKNATRPLSFASENDLMSIMGLIPGAVTPFGLLNDDERRVQFFIDKEFDMEGALIGVHPNDNTATIWLKVSDLLKIIEEHGNRVHIMEI